MKKVNPFDGTVHTAEGKVHAPEGNPVSGANLHAQTEEKIESKTTSLDKMTE